MDITADFYAGNIEFVSRRARGDIVLRIRPEPVPGFCQWFYFRVDGAADHPVELIIDNAGEALVPMGWPDYQAFASTDDRNWIRAPTLYRDGALKIAHAAQPGPVWYAYFPPYPVERRDALLRLCREQGSARVSTLCQTGGQDDVTLIELGNDAASSCQIWVIGRQHSGEVQASWWMEGFIRALLARDDPRLTAFLDRARLSIVPNMNPSGSRLGYHRSNERGVNLNASWAAPSKQDSAPVYYVLERMDQTGVDFCLDVHGDEELPYAFVANVDRVHPVPPDIEAVRERFQQRLGALDAAFWPNAGRTRPHTIAAPLLFCSPQIIHRFKAPAITLELPYKTIPQAAGARQEFGVAGCVRLGRACLATLQSIINDIAGLKRSRPGA
jgi:murein tripeptide amidase MpaA